MTENPELNITKLLATISDPSKSPAETFIAATNISQLFTTLPQEDKERVSDTITNILTTTTQISGETEYIPLGNGLYLLSQLWVHWNSPLKSHFLVLLLALFNHISPLVRKHIVGTVTSILANDKENKELHMQFHPVLIKATNDPDERVRLSTCEGLFFLQCNDPRKMDEVSQALMAATLDPVDEVQNAAYRALGFLKGLSSIQNATVTDFLCDAARNIELSTTLRGSACWGLAHLKDPGQETKIRNALTEAGEEPSLASQVKIHLALLPSTQSS